MKHLLNLTLAATCAAGLSAQELATATDYGSTAAFGTTKNANSTAKGTKITRVLTVTARAGSSRTGGAGATSSVTPRLGRGAASVTVGERGSATSSSADGAASAGTTTTKDGRLGAAHAVELKIPARDGAKGRLLISWTSRVSAAGATTAGAVSFNGREVAAFTSKDRPARKTLDVTAGKDGIVIMVKTSGMAAVKGRATASYGASLSAAFTTDTGGGDLCTFRQFSGRPCNEGGILSASAEGLKLTFRLDRARPNTQGVVFAAGLARRPIRLPGGGCTLSVVETPFVLKTDARGSASASVTLPRDALPINFYVQGGVVWTARNLLRIGTSNVVNGRCGTRR